uniref:Uncharacterized protein n=1 Tax=Anguilla anguilla TaxID=7936 RepID=A0A0E9RMR9_ANGAN
MSTYAMLVGMKTGLLGWSFSGLIVRPQRVLSTSCSHAESSKCKIHFFGHQGCSFRHSVYPLSTVQIHSCTFHL